MEGLIIFILIAVIVLGIKWVFSQDITSQDIRNDREKRWEENSLGLRKPFNREEAEEAARVIRKKDSLKTSRINQKLMTILEVKEVDYMR